MALPTGIRRLVLGAAGVPLVAAMTTMLLASPSSAAPQTVTTAQVLASNHHYRTLAAGLRVRRLPSTSAKTVHVLGKAGTKVTVNCWANGTAVFGDHVWYHIVKPAKGFVAGFYLNTGRDPAAGVVPCAIAVHVYQTLVKHLRVRKSASTKEKVVKVLDGVGTKVAVNCYRRGTSIHGDNVWYHLVAPARGYSAGFYLNTGRDPAPGIRHC